MTAVTPRELYDANPDVRKDLENFWHSQFSIDAAISSLDDLPTGPAAVDFMSELEERSEEEWYRAKDVITWLPPELIMEHYGRETLLWAAAASVFSVTATRHRNQLESLGGYRYNRFERARLWTWRERNSGKSKDVLAEYALATTVCEGGLDSLDIPEVINDALLPDVTKRDKRSHEYSLEPIEPAEDRVKGYAPTLTDEKDPRISYHVYMDGPTGIVLRHRGRPNAVVAFAMAEDDDLRIYQLQGLQGMRNYAWNPVANKYTGEKVSSRGLAVLDWHKVLVGAVTHIAKNQGLKSVSILGGRHNYWATHTMPKEKKPHLTQEQAAKSYDLPAERLGFSYGDDGNWHQPL